MTRKALNKLYARYYGMKSLHGIQAETLADPIDAAEAEMLADRIDAAEDEMEMLRISIEAGQRRPLPTHLWVPLSTEPVRREL